MRVGRPKPPTKDVPAASKPAASKPAAAPTPQPTGPKPLTRKNKKLIVNVRNKFRKQVKRSNEVLRPVRITGVTRFEDLEVGDRGSGVYLTWMQIKSKKRVVGTIVTIEVVEKTSDTKVVFEITDARQFMDMRKRNIATSVSPVGNRITVVK